MAEENALGSDRDSSPDLGEMWKCGCPKSPVRTRNYVEEYRFAAACHRASGGQGGVTMSFLCPNCNSFPWKTTCGGFQLGRTTAAGGAQSVEKI